jgi:GTP1/Obg family GTP-binding protein
MKEDGFEEYEKALKTCERMLAFEMDIVQESNIFRKIGDIYLEIFKKGNDLQSCEHAIQAIRGRLPSIPKKTIPIIAPG